MATKKKTAYTEIELICDWIKAKGEELLNSGKYDISNHDKIYYVYFHFLTETGLIFYVGKSTEYRQGYKYARTVSRKGKSGSWFDIADKNQWDIRIPFSAYNEDLIYDLEEETIKYIGRVIDGGELVNLTTGKGASGIRWSEEYKQNKREAVSGKNNPFYGRGSEHPRSWSINQIDSEGNTVKTFGSVRAAAKEIGRDNSTLYTAIKNNWFCAGYKWSKN